MDMARDEITSSTAADSPVRRRGPKPLLSIEQETQLVQWVQSQQLEGHRVSRDGVIAQAQKILHKSKNSDQTTQKLGMGWCNRFMARHPGLSLRPGGSAVAQQEIPALSEPATVDFTVNNSEDQEAASSKPTEDVTQADTLQDEADTAERTIKTRKYNRKHMEAAVEMYLAGRPMSDVTEHFPLLHQRTIRRRVLRVQRGEVDKRRGPRPLLEGEPEQELVDWILEMQSQGTKVTKKDILARANEQYRALVGAEADDNRLKEGWLRRFKERHPVLSGKAPINTRSKEEDPSSEDESPSEEKTKEVEVGEGQKQLKTERSGDGESSVSIKRQKTQEDESVDIYPQPKPRGSILPERRQTGKAAHLEKLDAILQSNKRLEEMQRQQLEMLQQLCASNKILSSITGGKRSTSD
ncbi:hypothetical protein P3T76_007676 [Phytophthora citrophthora]|uniref:HTH CENPB-type domain-containing protein n=1 Tax=Phytophthora citrophthora TaxID=4793 RepID=A0AAD9LLH2_9STRA|nr:hypothetical protein P3T76_007676 [Phytophthora citrophthora]